jgi:hypothetical protein
MQVEAVAGLRPHPKFDADRVVIRNRFGDIIAVVVEFQTDQFAMTSAGDTDFEQVLQNLGLANTIVVEQISAAGAPRIGD